MIPAIHPGANQPPDPVPVTITGSRAAPPRPTSPAPQIEAAAVKASRPALLSLKLNAQKSGGDTDAHDAGPPSPSFREKKKIERAITENGGRKRAIDGHDGPGNTVTRPTKRHKESSPPVSPRPVTSDPKFLVRQARPVHDLKTMAGRSPRRAETPSPPTSPRGGTPAVLSGTSGLPGSTDRTASTSSTPTASRAPTPGSPSIKPPAPTENMRLSSSSGLENSSRPGSSAEKPREFVFTESAFGKDGELIVAPGHSSAPLGQTADSGAASAHDAGISTMLIRAELFLKAKAQQDATASYLSALDRLRAKAATPDAGSAPGRSAQESVFQVACASLETDVLMCDMALQNADADEFFKWLEETVGQIVSVRNALATLADVNAGESTNDELADAQKALSASLEEMGIACKTGIDMLADERPASRCLASRAPSPSQQARPSSLTPAQETLLTDLELLLEKPI